MLRFAQLDSAIIQGPVGRFARHPGYDTFAALGVPIVVAAR
jgi:hypothetical protein